MPFWEPRMFASRLREWRRRDRAKARPGKRRMETLMEHDIILPSRNHVLRVGTGEVKLDERKERSLGLRNGVMIVNTVEEGQTVADPPWSSQDNRRIWRNSGTLWLSGAEAPSAPSKTDLVGIVYTRENPVRTVLVAAIALSFLVVIAQLLCASPIFRWD